MTGEAARVDPDESLRARNRVRVRGALARAAAKLFAARGFEAVTIDEIAAAAGVSRRTFFRYFEDKEAALFDRRREQLDRFRALLEAAPRRAGTFDVLKDALMALADDFAQRRAQVLAEQAIVRATPALAARDLEVDRVCEGMIAAWLLLRSARSAAAERRARLFAAALMGVVRVTIDTWAEGGGRADLKKLGAEALSLVAPLAPVR